MEEAVRVLVVGDASGSVTALRAGAGRRPKLAVSGPVSPVAVGDAVMAAAPDVVLVRAADHQVSEVLADIRAADPHVRVLVEGDTDVPGLVSAVLAAGGCGVLPPALNVGTVREAILRARAGELVLEDGELRSLVHELAYARAQRSAGGAASLTVREIEVLRAVAEGSATIDIAARLGISPTTVQSHVKNVLAKLGVHSKFEAVRVAWREGLAAVPA